MNGKSEWVDLKKRLKFQFYFDSWNALQSVNITNFVCVLRKQNWLFDVVNKISSQNFKISKFVKW